MKLLGAALLASLAVSAIGQPLHSNPGLPVSVNPTQLAGQRIAAQSAVAIQNLYSYTQADYLRFLVNTECLEASFDHCAAFGVPLHPELRMNGTARTGYPDGCRKANLSEPVRAWAEELGHNEAGHVRILREAIGSLAPPCPVINIDTAFGEWFNAAFNHFNVGGRNNYSASWDPYQDDIHFLLSTYLLEEIGATGDKGIVLFMDDLVLRDVVSGLATSAWGHASVDRLFNLQRINETVPEYGVTVAEFFAVLSNYRDYLDGPVDLDKPLVEYFDGLRGQKLVPTDGNGVCLDRTPQQVLSILTQGQGNGTFFPNGVPGAINSTTPLAPTPSPASLVGVANLPPVYVFNDTEIPSLPNPNVLYAPEQFSYGVVPNNTYNVYGYNANITALSICNAGPTNVQQIPSLQGAPYASLGQPVNGSIIQFGGVPSYPFSEGAYTSTAAIESPEIDAAGRNTLAPLAAGYAPASSVNFIVAPAPATQAPTQPSTAAVPAAAPVSSVNAGATGGSVATDQSGTVPAVATGNAQDANAPAPASIVTTTTTIPVPVQVNITTQVPTGAAAPPAGNVSVALPPGGAGATGRRLKSIV